MAVEFPEELGHRRVNGQWLGYWPAVVELTGKLSTKIYFGSPNFGENPDTDSKERSWIGKASR